MKVIGQILLYPFKVVFYIVGGVIMFIATLIIAVILFVGVLLAAPFMGLGVFKKVKNFKAFGSMDDFEAFAEKAFNF